jgi:hypothetical protein
MSTVYADKNAWVVRIDKTRPQMWLRHYLLDGVDVLYYFDGNRMYWQGLEPWCDGWQRCSLDEFEQLIKYGELIAYE